MRKNNLTSVIGVLSPVIFTALFAVNAYSYTPIGTQKRDIQVDFNNYQRVERQPAVQIDETSLLLTEGKLAAHAQQIEKPSLETLTEATVVKADTVDDIYDAAIKEINEREANSNKKNEEKVVKRNIADETYDAAMDDVDEIVARSNMQKEKEAAQPNVADKMYDATMNDVDELVAKSDIQKEKAAAQPSVADKMYDATMDDVDELAAKSNETLSDNDTSDDASNAEIADSILDEIYAEDSLDKDEVTKILDSIDEKIAENKIADQATIDKLLAKVSKLSTPISALIHEEEKEALNDRVKEVEKKLNSIKLSTTAVASNPTTPVEEAEEEETEREKSKYELELEADMAKMNKNNKKLNNAYCKLEDKYSNLYGQMNQIKQDLSKDMMSSFFASMMPAFMNFVAQNSGQVQPGFNGQTARNYFGTPQSNLGLDYRSLTDLFKPQTNNYYFIGQESFNTNILGNTNGSIYNQMQRTSFPPPMDAAKLLKEPYAFNFGMTTNNSARSLFKLDDQNPRTSTRSPGQTLGTIR